MTVKQATEYATVLDTAHRSFEKGLNAYALYKVNSQATSDDLVQETYLKTWKFLVKGGKIDMMKAFLYHILNNLIVDEYRKRKNVSLETLLSKGYEPGEDHTDRLLDMLDGKAALLLIQQVPERYAKVLRMRYVQDLSLAEISLITGQSKNTIAVQIHRGVEKLKQLYGV